MKMRLKMNSRLQRYDIHRPRPRGGQKYTKYKSIVMVICIKEYLALRLSCKNAFIIKKSM